MSNSTEEIRYLKARLDAAGDMRTHFERQAALTHSRQQKVLEGLKNENDVLKIRLQVAEKDRDALFRFAGELESRYLRVLSSRTWRLMAPFRVLGRFVRRLLSGRKSARNALPKRPRLVSVRQDASSSRQKD